MNNRKPDKKHNTNTEVITNFDATELYYQRKICKEVLAICQPLFENFNATLFSQARAHHDGNFTSLITHPELTEYYLMRKYQITGSQGAGLFFERGIYIAKEMGNTTQQQIRYDLCQRFNIDHLIFVVDRHKNYDDLYSFATTPGNNQFINHFINNIDLIKHFIAYFNDKSVRLMQKANKMQYSTEYFDSPSAYDSNIIAVSEKLNTSEFLQKTIIKKIRLCTDKGEITISLRELDCLRYLTKNYTFKEIGKYLALSPRTVETYINNLKDKLGCEKRSQLIEVATQLNLPL